MKSTKSFNNISDKLKASIPKLKPGQIVTFQMLHGTPNPEPEEKERSKNPVLYGKRQVQTNCRIYDPYLKDEDGKEVGGYVDIGCVDIWNKDVPEKFRLLVPGMGEYSQFQGRFSLTGGNIRDEELYEVLWLSNEREGNENRDKSVEALYKIMDVKADSKTSTDKVSMLRRSLQLADKIEEADARRVMAALNQPNYQDKDVLMAKIGEMARDKYELFLKTYDDPKSHTKAEIKEALDAKVISHDIPTGQLSIGGTKLTILKVESQEQLLEAATAWITSAENGKDILSNIRKQLKKAEA